MTGAKRGTFGTILWIAIALLLGAWAVRSAVVTPGTVVAAMSVVALLVASEFLFQTGALKGLIDQLVAFVELVDR